MEGLKWLFSGTVSLKCSISSLKLSPAVIHLVNSTLQSSLVSPHTGICPFIKFSLLMLLNVTKIAKGMEERRTWSQPVAYRASHQWDGYWLITNKRVIIGNGDVAERRNNCGVPARER